MAIARSSRPVDVPAGVRDSTGKPEWGSDLIVDILRLLGIEYASLLPGSTFRGLHDSLVNYAANRGPETILCNHEMITVAMARGYARATGRPMAAIVHDTVGLMNTCMTVYDAWCDRVPVLILGGTGPMDATRRRPGIDWTHTALVQGNLVRDYVKWDDQPGSVAAIPESMLRAYRIAVTEPAGPVYVNFDVDHQEADLRELQQTVALPDVSRFRAGAPPEPDRGALREAARLLVNAQMPLCFADRVGRSASAVRSLVELAELLAMPVSDAGQRFNFPTPHALEFTDAAKSFLGEADVILGLDMWDLDGAMKLPVNYATRQAERPKVANQRVISITLEDYQKQSLMTSFQALPAVDVPLLADTGSALPLLIEECQQLIDGAARARIDQRRSHLESRQAEMRARQKRQVEAQWSHAQTTETRLVSELWNVVKDEEFVFTYGRFNRMAPGIVQIAGPEQHYGTGGGGAVGAVPGVALGSALALKGSGKLPVALLGDGEMFASIQTLWTAAHYQIPSLWVINNNRSYYNDEDHQDRIAKVRDRPPENKWVAMRMERPEVDFGAITRTFGLHGEGPIKDANDLGPALRRAIEAVKQGQLAVLDVWTENRGYA